ncbi:transmembrane protein, putative (macronuclear) [Tetrahymena thermophila SB210]|uniref:Transmembrane protein, putative n=1 Tax=Tetrahymena thermophila (strain SB210) TaxID=312017 RepID=W7XEJ2_TETTS|nr:transmembrane protein, putative [Tetrahymena thermophila SB210]EWS76147.1 transmembrane protein, putative [Tetrahymena thermophila SB210]|eukprot:XP_012651318.1 transmembrane protein, putative [Tetrahymena thermophila SB210]
MYNCAKQTVNSVIIIKYANNVFLGIIIRNKQTNASHVIHPVKLVMVQIQIIAYLVVLDCIIIRPQSHVFVIQPVKLVMVQIQTIAYLAILDCIIIKPQSHVFVIQPVKLVTAQVKLIVYLVTQGFTISKLQKSVQNLVIKMNFQIYYYSNASHVIKVVQAAMERIQIIVQVVTLTIFFTTKFVLAYVQMDFKVILTLSHAIHAKIIGAHNAIPAIPTVNNVISHRFKNVRLAIMKQDKQMFKVIDAFAKTKMIKGIYFINAAMKILLSLMQNQVLHFHNLLLIWGLHQ